MLTEPRYLVSRPRKHHPEGMVGGSLVAALKRQYAIECRVKAIERRLGADEVDLIIGLSRGQFAVECLAYVQRDEAYQYEFASVALAADLADRLSNYGLLPRCVSPFWRSRLNAGRSGRKGGRRLCFPRKAERSGYLADCADLVRDVQLMRGGQQAKVQWGPPEWNRPGLFPESILFVEPERFPYASRYLQSVDLSEVDLRFPGTVQSGTSARMIGADITATLEGIDKKLKRLPAYRRVAAGWPLVLLIHEDGHPLSRVLPEMHRNRMFDAIRDHLLAQSERFDAVWWLHTACSHPHAELVGVAR